VIQLLEAHLGAPVLLEELKRKPSRRSTFRAVGSKRTAIVKFYASDRASVVAARVAALSRGPGEPCVPEVLLVEPDYRMVVLSDVEGDPLRTPVLAGDADACRRAGTALGRWHGFWQGLSPASLRPHTIEKELEILRAHAHGAPAAIAAATLSALSSLADVEWAPATVVHRDLYEEQVLLGDEVGLIDLDDAALGPPELDIGNLLAHLDLLGLRAQRDLGAMQKILLEGYASGGGVLDPALLGRCRVLALLRVACIHQDARLAERAADETAEGPAARSRLDSLSPVPPGAFGRSR
jgi:Ser/Thr protein kinase RdoA (MazF antagonist)